MRRKNSGGRGFTLVELMFSLAIVGVLSAIAIPAYNGYVEKNNNNKAIADIKFIQLCIERFYTVNFNYPAAITDLATSCLPNNGIDPWGNAYVYLNIIDGGSGIHGQVRKDRHLNPINSLYDLYSMGPDGVTHKQLDNRDSVDDIVLALDGAFVGVSSDF
jgi:general secretion pathway protein G